MASTRTVRVFMMDGAFITVDLDSSKDFPVGRQGARTPEGGLAFSAAFRVVDQIEKSLRGGRTQGHWYQGFSVRTGKLWRSEKSDLWFIETGTNGLFWENPDYTQLSESEAIDWLVSHGYRKPGAPAEPPAADLEREAAPPREKFEPSTPAQLRLWLVQRAKLWASPATPIVLSAGWGVPNPVWHDLVAAYRHMDRLGIPGAPPPPYQAVSEADSLTMLRRIANELNGGEPEPRPLWANDEAIARERRGIANRTEAIEQLEKTARVTPDRKALAEIFALRDAHRRQIQCHEHWFRMAGIDPAPPASGTEAPADKAVAASERPILLDGPNDAPVVYGRIKLRLTPGQYRVVKALLDAHPDRLSKDQLAIRSETEDPIGMIDRLHAKDEDWKAVLDKPGQAHGGYGIRVGKPRKATPRKR